MGTGHGFVLQGSTFPGLQERIAEVNQSSDRRAGTLNDSFYAAGPAAVRGKSAWEKRDATRRPLEAARTQAGHALGPKVCLGLHLERSSASHHSRNSGLGKQQLPGFTRGGRESFSADGFPTWQAGWPKKTPDPVLGAGLPTSSKPPTEGLLHVGTLSPPRSPSAAAPRHTPATSRRRTGPHRACPRR